jgi:uracil-DNA glycosylase
MPHEALPPFSSWAGPRDARCVFVAEAWGENEAALRKPLVGWSGRELFKMLGEAMPDVAPELHTAAVEMFKYDLAWVPHREPWLREARIAMTNVLNLRPPGNKLEQLCVAKRDLPDKGKGYDWPAIARNAYLLPEYLPEVDRLFEELVRSRPNLVVALGNTACWALLRATNIGAIRGAATLAHVTVAGRTLDIKCLPTYHPAGVLRQWNWRPIVVADLMKASREAGFPELRRPKRQVLVNPSIHELKVWTAETLIARGHAIRLACDCETGAGQIKCISFARSPSDAIVVPLVDLSLASGSYWPSLGDELAAWQCVRALLESNVPKVFQNGLYDLMYILPLGIRVNNCTDDTMLLHHSLFPELKKGLGFLGSIYTSEASWKLMRRRRPDTEKRDE